MEKVEGTGRINACIERVFGYKARVKRMFLNISRLLEIIEREDSELLLYVKNSQELGSSPFPYIAPVIPFRCQERSLGVNILFLLIF